MGRWLVLAGAVPFLVLGGLHLLYTLRDERRPRAIVPRDAALIEAMRTDTLRLTRETTVWRAWIGFNVSHSIAVILVGLVPAYFALWDHAHFAASPALVWSGPALGAVFILLSWRYFFSRPLIGSSIGTALMAAGAAAITAGA